MSKATSLLAQAAQHAKTARQIAERAEAGHRKMTVTEQADFDHAFKEATSLKAKADAAAKDEDVLGQARELAAQVGDAPGAGWNSYSGTKAVTGRTSPGSPWASQVADQLAAKSAQFGVKAITTGSIDVAAPLSPGVVPIPDLPRRLLDLVVDREMISGKVFTYPRQTVRTNNAAPVADGATKPTSVYTFEEIEDTAKVVAHLTEPIPERLLADHESIQRVLTEEMEHDLLLKVENQVVSGNGTGENMTGILSTSGTVAIPWTTDLLSTCRRARTTMFNLGEVPNAWAFNPADVETIDLMRDASGGAGTGSYLVNTSSLANIFGDLPRISVPGVPAGQAILADWTQSRLVVREDARLDADRSGANFTSNQVQLRCEGRYGFAVLRPQAFAVLDLTAV